MLEFKRCLRERWLCLRETEEREKSLFFNLTGIILRGNIFCISYSSSPGLESYCSKSKKKFGDGEVVGGVFLCEQ